MGCVWEALDSKGRVAPRSLRPDRPPPLVEGRKGSTFLRPARPLRPPVGGWGSVADDGAVAGPLGIGPTEAGLGSTGDDGAVLDGVANFMGVSRLNVWSAPVDEGLGFPTGGVAGSISMASGSAFMSSASSAKA